MSRSTGGGTIARVGLLGSLALALSLGAAAAAAPGPRDIFGVFIGIGGGRPDIDARWRNKPFTPTPEFTAAGAEQSRQLGRLGIDVRIPSPCDPVNPVTFMAANGLFPVQILQGQQQIVMLNEWVPVARHIYMDGRGHPSDLLPTWLGHSIGHWEGNVLVIDTVGLNGRARPLNAYAANGVSSTQQSLADPRLPASDQMHVVERIRLVDGGRLLEVVTTITDPKYYTRPVTNTGYLERRPDIDLQEYYCADNMRTHDEGQPGATAP